MAVAVCCLLSGCIIGENAMRRLDKRVAKWVPKGTPKDKAIRIMKSHEFECTAITRGHGIEAKRMISLERRGLFWSEALRLLG